MMHKATSLDYTLAVLLGLGSVLMPRLSPAHPLGNFSISHYTSLRLEPGAVVLRYSIDMAEIPAFQELQEHGMVPQVEAPVVRDYLARQSAALGHGLQLLVDGRPLTLQEVGREVLFPPGAGGLATLKLALVYRAELAPTAPDTTSLLHYRDNNFPGRTGWQEIIAVAEPGVELLHSSVPTTDRSQALTNYPTELLNSPPQVLEARLSFRRQALPALALPPQAASASVSLAAPRQATPGSAFTALVTTPHVSLGVLCLSLAVAAGLGALHALEPGHGKTVLAAYLVGSRGTARQALSLGLVVTATHTAGVYLLGAVTLYASHYIVPEQLYPWLGVLSGSTIAILGLSLLLRRSTAGGSMHPQLHHHEHHSHGHADTLASRHSAAHHAEPQHGQQQHHAQPLAVMPSALPHCHPHPQHPFPGVTVSWRELLTLGITGGIVPCPAALVVLLSAVALQRIGFGLLLIVAFSIGLAAVLMSIGLLMVYARQFMARFQEEGFLLKRCLPLISAVTVTVCGIAMTLQALATTGVLHLRL